MPEELWGGAVLQSPRCAISGQIKICSMSRATAESQGVGRALPNPQMQVPFIPISGTCEYNEHYFPEPLFCLLLWPHLTDYLIKESGT